MATYLYSAFTKIVFLLILVNLWVANIFPAANGNLVSLSYYADGIKLVGQYWFSLYLYPFFPYQFFLAAQQFAVLVISIKMLMWIFAPGTTDTSGSGAGQDHATASGFSSKSIYN